MQDRLPEKFDPWKLAASGERLEGVVPLAALPRLADLLRDDGGEVRFRLEGARDAEGRKLIRGHVEADVRLSCQRCFGPVLLPLRIDVALALIADESRAGSLPEAYEPLVADETGVTPAALAEDELILALPLVALHDDVRECEAHGFVLPDAAAGPAERKRKPFAGLSALLKESNKDQE